VFGHHTPLYHRVRLEEKPGFATLAGVLGFQLQALEKTIGPLDFTEGEFVITVEPFVANGTKSWDVITSWGDRP
jgi:hypothetical protein